MKKHYYFSLKKLFFTILFLSLFYTNVFSQLSGNYTINPLSAAGSTNYKTWASAVSDLLSGTRADGGTAQGPGVSNAVVFTVYDSVYSGVQVKLSAISGASATNTITFKSAGGDSTKCKLVYPTGSSATDDYVLMLDGADYIRFQEIGFERTGNNTYYSVLRILNDANYNNIIRCWMKTRKVPSSTSKGWTIGIGAHIYFNGNGDTNLFIQNKMIYGYNGIYDTIACSGNSIVNNVFDTTGCIGIYMTSQTNLNISANTFNLGDFGSGQGHYISYAIRLESSPAVMITKNKMYMLANNAQVVRAIVLVSVTGSSSLPSLINNNWILNAGGTTSCSGISLYGVNYLDFYYNNCLITNSLSAGAIIHHNSTYTNSYIEVKNNNLINKGGGLLYDFPSTNGGLDTVVNNNCYTTGTVLGKMGGTTYSSLSAWVSNTGKDANSLNIDPGYVSNTNLHVSNIGLNGKAFSYWRVKDDIDGDTRHATTPDIGADEFYPIANDAGISSLDSPLVFCAGNKNVKVKFQNYGSDTIKSLQIYWQLNGTSQTTFNWSGNVPPGSSSASILLGNKTFSSNTAYTFKIWTANPNSTSDGNKQNDTLILTRYAGMSGNYTIGASGSDFQSFNNAISAMTSRGICGAVNFNVNDGIYNEQLTIAELPGMGSSNPVVFKGISSDSSKVVIRLPSTTATGNNNAIVQLTGADYVTFKWITFQRTGTNSISEVVHILNGANNNTFTNCQMINTVINSSNATGVNIWSDQGTDNNNTFKYNFVKFGTYCVQYVGVSTAHESGTIFEGNVFDSAYSSLVQVSYNDGVTFKGNVFRNSISNVANNYDMQLSDCDNAIKVMANYFYNTKTDNAIYLTGCNATSSANGLVANNFITKTGINGVYMDAVDYQFVVFNNINFSGSVSNISGITTSGNTSSNIVMKNNNIVVATGYVFYIYTGTQVSASNRNNLKANGSTFAYWGSSYSNLSALSTATGKDLNSMSVNPLFISNTDLHIKNSALKGAAEPISGVTTDIDGETRDPSTPDIGADEFTIVANDAGIVAITQPNNPSCEGVLPVVAVIKNFGKDTLKSATINWRINSSSQTPKSWTGSLKNMATDTVLLGSYNFTGNSTPSILVCSSLPNAQTDGSTGNDTLITTKQIKTKPVVSAGADQSLCIGDSLQIGPTPVTGYSYKWMLMNNTVIGTSSKIFVKPTVNTSYVLEMTDVAAGCSNTDTILITIVSIPKSDFTVNTSPQCLTGNNFVFTNTSTGATGYLWNFGDYITSSSTSPTHSYTSAKSYNVKLVAYSIAGCKDSIIKTIEVLAHPVCSFTINNSTQCLHGNLFTFTNTSTGYNTSVWNFGDTSFSLLNSPAPKTYTFLGTKTVKLVVTSSFGCKDSNINTVDVMPHPKSSFTIDDDDQCLSDNNFIFNNTSSGAASFTWYFGDQSTSNNISPLHIYSSDGTFSVKLMTSTIFGCKDSLIKNVFVRPQPKAGITLSQTESCLKNNNFSFTDNSNISSGNINSYYWDFNDASSGISKDISHSFTSDGKYNVMHRVTTDYGCSDSVYKIITVHPQPKADFTINDSVQCLVGNNFIFSNMSAIKSGSLDYDWDLGDGTVNHYTNNIHSYSTSGTYTVWLRANSSKACRDSINRKVIVKPNPVIYLGEDDTLYNAEFMILKAGSGYDSYLWSNNATSEQITVDSTKFGLGVKTIWVKATKDGCDGYDTINITILKHESINETDGNHYINIYPNPVRNTLNLVRSHNDYSELSIMVFDVSGKNLIMDYNSGIKLSDIDIDVSMLASGIYILKVIASENEVFITKFIKE